MRVSPVGWAFGTLEETLAEAARSAEVTHNHPEGIKGAQATAAAIFLARHKESKAGIREFIQTRFGYNMNRTIEDIRPGYSFDDSCQGTVPEAFYGGVPKEIAERAMAKLDDELQKTVERFYEAYGMTLPR